MEVHNVTVKVAGVKKALVKMVGMASQLYLLML